jgi:hypothetical protein
MIVPAAIDRPSRSDPAPPPQAHPAPQQQKSRNRLKKEEEDEKPHSGVVKIMNGAPDVRTLSSLGLAARQN